jgi:hypothetical protein
MDLQEVVEALALPEKILYLRFTNGKDGMFCFEDYFPYEGIFKKLKNKSLFNKVSVNQFGTIEWPGNLDLSPEVLYAIVTQQKIVVKGKIVFDPSLGKGSWLKSGRFA